MDRVFVYGTMKRGGVLHGVLEDSRVRKVAIDGVAGARLYVNRVTGLPRMVRVKGRETVWGEVYDVPKELMTGVMDRIEGADRPYGYSRRVLVLKESGQVAWAYVWEHEIRDGEDVHVESGWYDTGSGYEVAPIPFGAPAETEQGD